MGHDVSHHKCGLSNYDTMSDVVWAPHLSANRLCMYRWYPVSLWEREGTQMMVPSLRNSTGEIWNWPPSWRARRDQERVSYCRLVVGRCSKHRRLTSKACPGSARQNGRRTYSDLESLRKDHSGAQAQAVSGRSHSDLSTASLNSVPPAGTVGRVAVPGSGRGEAPSPHGTQGSTGGTTSVLTSSRRTTL